MATKAQQQQFVTTMAPQALAAAQMITGSSDPNQLKTAQIAILSQWAGETGWGIKSDAAINGNNFAGIKCWSGCVCGGVYCKYATIADFTVAYSKFMTTQDVEGNYTKLVDALKTGSVSQILAAMETSKWAGGHYSDTQLLSISNTVASMLGLSLPSTPSPLSPATSSGACVPPSGLTDITGGLAYLQCSLVQDLKWVGVNLLVFAILIMLLYLLVNDTQAGRYVIEQGKSAVKEAAVAAAA